MTQNESTVSAKPLIAVVDDDASFLRSVARLLASAGYAVNTFDSGEAFLATLHHTIPSCLVLDIHMPKVTGLDLREQLAREGVLVPTVFMTAFDNAKTLQRARAVGGWTLLIKPFDRQELLNAISQAMQSSPVNSPAPRGG